MSSRHVSLRHTRYAAFGRLALWLAGLLFVVQMLAATQHHHDLSTQSSDCVSCVHNAQLPSAPPEPALQEVALRLARLQYRIVHAPPVTLHSTPDHLIPPAHGPPSSHS